jgi:hypothetical protein
MTIPRVTNNDPVRSALANYWRQLSQGFLVRD